MSEITQPAAEFAVDSNARLGIGKGEQRINLDPTEVVAMLDFLSSITYKTLAQRAGAEASRSKAACATFPCRICLGRSTCRREASHELDKRGGQTSRARDGRSLFWRS